MAEVMDAPSEVDDDQQESGFRPATVAPAASDGGFRAAVAPSPTPAAQLPPPSGGPSQADVDAASVQEPSAQPVSSQPSATPSSVSAYEPSLMEQTRAAVGNSAVGRAIESTMPKVASALNIQPTASESNPQAASDAQQLIAPEYFRPAVSEAVGVRERNNPAQPINPGQNRVEGALDAAGNLTSGKTMATIAGTAIAAGLTAGVINPATAHVLGRLASGGFTADMLYGLYRQNQQYRQAVDRGDTATAQKIQGEMGVNGAMAALSALHASGASPEITRTEGDYGERGVRLSVGDKASAEVGFRPAYRQPSPEGGYGDGSTVVPGKVTGRATLGERRFGTPTSAAAPVPPTAEAPEPKALPSPDRPVVQGSTNPDEIRASAQAQEPALNDMAEKVVEGVDGAEVVGSRVKDAESQENKADRDKPHETNIDHLGARISVETPEARAEVAKRIAEQLPVESKEPIDTNGLDADQFAIRTGRPGEANQVSELQVVPKAQADAMKETDELYHQQKEALARGDQAEADRLEKQITKIHEDALDGEKATKYSFGSTQANIPEGSEAHSALMAAGKKIDPADLNPTSYGGDGSGAEPDPHVTVRYGVRGEDTAELEKFIRSLSPFEAKLGKTSSFPPSESSDGGAVIKADVESPELHRINAEIEKHGDFEPSNFPEYVPHATVAYVKPDAVSKYVGMTDTEGKTFPVKSIALTDRNGNAKEIPLQGGKSEDDEEGGRGKSPEQPAGGGLKTTAAEPSSPPAKLVKGSSVTLPDGSQGTLQWMMGDKARVKLSDGSRRDVKRNEVKASEPAKGVTVGTPGHDKPKPGAIAIDLDKTLAEYDGYKGPTVIGKPIAAQVEQVKQMLADGKDVWLYSARAGDPASIPAMQAWTKEHIGETLPITNVKYDTFARFIDDRAELPVQMQEGNDAKPSTSSDTAATAEGGWKQPVRQEKEAEPEGATGAESRPGAGELEGKKKEVTPLDEKREAFKATQSKREVMLKPGESGEVPVSALILDPKRFQYKVSNIGKEGVSDLLAGKRWNPDLAGVVSVWRDPEDGKTYVVNGHHRVDLAKKTGTKTMLVRMLSVKDAVEARAVGAFQNIADGRGTIIDAAKFFRDSGISVDDLDSKGISMGERTAQDGVALSRLDSRLFDMVIHGKMSQGRGVAIGRETPDAVTQDAVLKMIESAERRGQKVSDGTVAELARFSQTAPQRQETVGNLFGAEKRTTSTALDKAQVSANILRELGAEKRTFGAVASADRAERLSATGNRINAADNAMKATEAQQAQEVYLRLSSRRGPIDDILNRAAEERSNAKPSEIAAIDKRAYEDVRAAVSETLGQSEGGRTERGEELTEQRPSRADLEAAGQGGFFARRKPSGSVESLSFPGMETDVERQKESAANVKAETEKQAVEQSLTTPKGDISKAAGEMERNSPLFFGTGAGGHDTLFSRTGPTWYLKSERLIDQKMKGPMSGEQVLRMLENGGVKADELKWTGLPAFLQGKFRVTPEQVKQHLAESGVQLKEAIKGGKISTGNRQRMRDIGEELDEIGEPTEDTQERWDALSKEMDELEKPDRSNFPTKYSGYQLPGGENYRELLLTLPAPNASLGDDMWRVKYRDGTIHQYGNLEAAQREASRNGGQVLSPNTNDFRSSHWDEPNILAHIRFNDRMTSEGKRLLHLEEIQSDWGQRLRTQRGIIKEAVDGDLDSILKKMKAAGELEIEC